MATSPTTAVMTGPMTGARSTASGNFTITLDQAATASVSCVITSSVGGDTITSTPVVIGIGNSTGTFTVTPSTNAPRTITLTSATTTSTPNSLTCTGAIVYTTSTVVKTITLDNAAGPSATNQLVVIPLSRSTVSFGSIQSDGRNLGVLASDGTTVVPTSLRDWAGSVGLRYDAPNSLFLPASGGGHAYTFATCLSTGPLGSANDPHTLTGVGQINDPNPSYGQWDLYDSQLNHVWTYASPSQDYPMAAAIGDLSGSGDYAIAVGSRLADHAGYVLNPDGSLRWSAVFGANGQANAPYIRAAAIGKITNSYAGNQVVFGGQFGQVSCYSSTGATVWGPLTLVAAGGGNQTLQAGLIADLTGGGTQYFYCVQGYLIRQIDGTGTVNWTYTLTLPFPVVMGSIAVGHITSTTTKQLVTSTAAVGTSQCGIISVVNSSGTLLWNKVCPYRFGAVIAGDVNADGYDEIIAMYGCAPPGTFTQVSDGGFIILDRNGNEITCGSMSGVGTGTCYGAYDGASIPSFSAVTDDRRLLRYRADWGMSGALAATLPSVTATSTTQQLTIATMDLATYLPPLGDFPFILSGSNGSAPPGMTGYRGSPWTIQSGWVQSANYADSGNSFLEATGVSTDGLEFEFTGQMIGQGTQNGTLQYSMGCAYRCTAWVSNTPSCLLFYACSTGSVDLVQIASNTGATVETLFTTSSSGLTFSTTDTVRFRVVASGKDHSASYSKNGGPWTLLYWVLDAAGTPLLNAGTVALWTGRGQSQYQDLVLRKIPSAYSDGTVIGPAPIPVLSLLAPTVYPAAMMMGL
ncbi:MAG: hypothetical protein ACLQIB_07205 [Isosphaeraceae bacterium]